MKHTFLVAIAAVAALSGAARAQETVPAPSDLPISQTVDGVTLTLDSVEYEELPNPIHHNVFLHYTVASATPDAQPAPGRTLESYVTSPLWVYNGEKTSPGRVGKVDGKRVLAFIAFPTDKTHLPMRVSFRDPRVKLPGKDLNRVKQVTFEGVPIPRTLNEPIEVNAEYKAEYGAIVTLKTVTMVPHKVNSDSDKRTGDDRDLIVVMAIQQPAPVPAPVPVPAPAQDAKSKARLEYIDDDWNSLFFARDNKKVEWTRGNVSFGSPSDFYSNGNYSYTFPVRSSSGAQTLDVEFGLREIVNYILPPSAFRRFSFDVDLKNKKSGDKGR